MRKQIISFSRGHSGLLTGLLIAFVLLSFSSGSFSADSADSKHGYYQRLASAFLHGDLAIDEVVPPSLQSSENPYDPEVSAPFRTYGIHDAVLFENKFYYYWGPGAVIFTVVPAKLIGINLTETDIGLGSVAVIAVLLGLIIDLLFANQKRKILLTIGLACNFPLAFLITRIAIWEAGILYAAAFATLAIYLTLRWINSDHKRPYVLILASVAIGVAMTTRSETGILMLPILIAALTASPNVKDRWFLILKSCVAPTFAVLGLILYNWLRFQHPLEFGVKNMIGGLDQTKIVFSSFDYVRFNLQQYFTHGWSFTEYFPFIKIQNVPLALNPQGKIPGTEVVVGFFWTHIWLLPFLLMVPRVFNQNSKSSLHKFGIGLIGASLIQFVFLSYAIFSSSERYAVMPSITASVGVLVLISRVEKKTMVMNTASLLAIPSAFLALLGASHGYYPDRVPNNFAVKFFSGTLSPFSAPKTGTPVSGLLEQDRCITDISIGSSSLSIGRQETSSIYHRLELTLPVQGTEGFSPIASFGSNGASDVFGVSWDGKTARVLRDKWRQNPLLSENILLNPSVPHTMVITSNVSNSTSFVFIDGFLVLSDPVGLPSMDPIIGVNTLQASTVSPISNIGVQPLPARVNGICASSNSEYPADYSLFNHCLIRSKRDPKGITRLDKLDIGTSSLSIQFEAPIYETDSSLPLISSGIRGRGDIISIIRRGKSLFIQHDHWGFPPVLSQALQFPTSNVLSLTVVSMPTESLTFVEGSLVLRSARFYKPSPGTWRVGLNDIGATTAAVNFPLTVNAAKTSTCEP